MNTDVIDGTRPLPVVAGALVEAERQSLTPIADMVEAEQARQTKPAQRTEVIQVRVSSVKSGVSVWLPERFRSLYAKRGAVASVRKNGDGTLRVQINPTPRSFRGKKVRPGKPTTLRGKDGFYLQFAPHRVEGLNRLLFAAVDATKVNPANDHITFWLTPVGPPMVMNRPKVPLLKAPEPTPEPEVQPEPEAEAKKLVHVIMCNDFPEGVTSSLPYATGYCDAANMMAKRKQEQHGGSRPRWHHHMFVLHEGDEE